MIYKFCEEKLYNPEIGFYISYGIEAKASLRGATIKRVSDLFLEKAEAQKFAELLNECEAELVHFEELCQSAIE